MQRRVGVAAADALYESAYDVVVLLPAVAERPLPHRPLHVRGFHLPRAGSRDLQGVQHPPPVAAGEAQQVLAPVFRDADAELLETAVEQGVQIILAQRPEPQHARAGEERRRYLEDRKSGV